MCAVRSFYSFIQLKKLFPTFCRREYGYCKIGWRQTSDTDSFKLSRPASSYNSATGPGQCDTDGAIIIGQWSPAPGGSNNDILYSEGNNLGSSSICGNPTASDFPSMDRYCGGRLSCKHNAKVK